MLQYKEKVKKAFEAGETVQVSLKDANVWVDHKDVEPSWSWDFFDYRIKPVDTEDKIKVMQAYVDGRTIQYKPNTCAIWLDCDQSLDLEWDWKYNKYRIKPDSPKDKVISAIEDELKRTANNHNDYAFGWRAGICWVGSLVKEAFDES